MNRIQKIIILIFVLACYSCKQRKIDGISIGIDLYNSQNVSENKKLCNLIDRTINEDETALKELIYFPCSASDCYDLGEIFVQIINKLGESKFMEITNKVNADCKMILIRRLEGGIEYGSYDEKLSQKIVLELK